MSRISTYEVVPVPKLADKLIGTSVGGEIEDITYNFTLGELLNLFIPNIPASGLQGVLDIGNTATQNINLFGIITTTNLEVTDTANLFITYLNEETHIVGSVYDSYDFVGTAGDVLTSTGAGVEWVTLPPIFTPNLQQVLEVGNTADIDIILDANIVALDINVDTETVNNNITIDGTITDGYSSIGTSNQVLSSTGTKVKWVNLPAYSAISPLFFNNITGVFSIQKADSTHDGYLSYLDWITFDGKQNAGNYITALTGEATASGPGSASIILNNSSVTSKVLTGLNVTGGSISAADSILTAFGKVQSQLNGLVGGLYFKGSWNALINNPTLTSSVGTQGWYYIVSVAGNTNLNGITDWQVGDWAIFNGATWDKIDNTDSVTSVNGQIGAVNLTTDNISEGTTNLYYLNSRARTAISLTTIGTSGAATYNNVTGVLNIPSYLGGVSSFNSRTGAVVPTEGDYTLTQLGDVTITTPTTGQVLKYNGTIWVNGTDADTGTVTSVAISVPTGLSVAGSPITSSGTLAVTYSAGYSIPTTASQANWDTAYNNRITSLTTTGTSGVATLVANVLNIPNYTTDLSGYVPNTRTLTINGTGYDLSADRSWNVGTVTSVAALTLGTSGTDLSSTVATGTTTPVITLNVPTSSATNRGVLSSADWTTFNNKANALSGTTNTVPKFNSSTTIGDSNIKDNGNVVSINATAGSFGALQVGNYNGSILMNTTDASGGLIFQNTSSSNKLWDFSSYGNNINFNESTVGYPVMTLQAGGNVGIKQINPAYQLDINGTFHNTGVVTLDNLAGSGNRMVIANSLGVLSTQIITTGTVTAVTASSPLFSSGGNTPNITIQQSSGSQNGYLSSTDWTTFNNKQASGNYITSLTGEATGTGPGATAVTLNNAAVTGKVLTGINITGGTVVDTDSILTGFGKLQNQINGLIGGSIYQGTWNANTNTPTLTSGVGVKGYYYIVSVAGTTNLDGITDWFVGDWAIFDGTAWQQVDNTDAVVSVNGQTGAVSLTTDNIPEGTTNLYFLNSRARAALSFTAGSGAYNSTTGVITIPTNTSQLTNGANFITLASLSATSPIGYNSSTGAISITQSGTASNGYLSSTDWNTFNGKQNALTNPITGTGTVNYLPKFTGTTAIGNSALQDDGSGTLSYNAISSNNATLALNALTSSSSIVTFSQNGIKYFMVGSDATASFRINSYTGATFNGVALYVPTGTSRVLLGNNVTDNGVSSLQVLGGTYLNGTLQVTGIARFDSTLTNGTYTYTLPSATGTLALTSALSGYVPTSRTLTINGVGYDLSADRSWTVTSMVYPSAGIALSTGTAWGTSITDNSADWNTAYTNRITSLTTTGTSGAATLIANVLNIPNYAPSPAARNEQTFTATAGQTTFSIAYTVGQLDVYYNGSKLAPAEFTATNGTSFTLATACFAGDIVDAVAYITGAGVGGSGTTNYISKFTGSTTLGNSLIWDNGTNVGIGNTNTSYTFDVTGTGRFSGQLHIPNNSTGTLGGLYFDYNANAASRNWQIVSDYDVYGDFQIRQSTTQTGSTYSKILGFSPTGAATFSSSVSVGGYLTGQGTNPGGLGGSRYVLDWLSGSMRVFSYGANTSTNGGFLFNSQRSDGTNSLDFLTIASTGAATFKSGSTSIFDAAGTRGITIYPSISGTYHLISSDYNGGSYYPLVLSARGNGADLYLNTNGNVGIGTTSNLSSKLVVDGSLSIGNGWGTSGATLDITPNATASNGVILSVSEWSGGFGPMIFHTSNTPRLTIASTGAATFSSSIAATLGTFTSAPTLGNAQMLLTSNSGSNTSYGGLVVISSTGKGGYLTVGDNSATTWYGGQASFVTLGATTGAGIKLRVNADDNAGITIPTSGNVGIGTTSPDVTGFGWKTLTIKGGTSSGEAGVLELQSATTTGAANLGIIAFLDGSNRNAQIGVQRDASTSTANMLFYTNAGAGIVERLRISSGGQMSSMYTQPNESATYHQFNWGGGGILGRAGYDSYFLGNAYYDGAWKYKYANGASMMELNDGIIKFSVAGTGTSNGALSWASAMTITSSGGINVTNFAGTGSRAVLTDASGNLSAPVSDSSVKENIKPLNYGIADIMKLKPVSFEYIESYKNYGEGKQIGNIAQDMAKVIPEAVFTTELTGKMGINYDQLNGIYIKALQELQLQNEALIKRIEQLENK